MNDFKFIAMDETKSETKVTGNIYLYDLFFMLIYFTVAAMLGTVVSSTLRIAYYAFNVICAFWLTMKSHSNRQRRNYQSIVLFLRRDYRVYKDIVVEDNRKDTNEEN